MSEHDKLVEVTRNADEIQTTFIGFLMDGRVIEIGDINHKPNRDNTRRIVAAVNNHERLVSALEEARAFLYLYDRDNVRAEKVISAVDGALQAEKGGEL